MIAQYAREKVSAREACGAHELGPEPESPLRTPDPNARPPEVELDPAAIPEGSSGGNGQAKDVCAWRITP